jgi:hypothetical protein
MTGTALTAPSNLSLLAELEANGAIVDKGLHLPPDLPFERYEAIGAMLGYFHDVSKWLVGDWIAYGEDTYRDDMYAQACEVTGLSPNTLQNYVSTARMVPPRRRRPRVSFSHHQEVKGLTAEAQKRLLLKAEREQLTKMDMRALVKLEQGREEPPIERDVCGECGRPL